MSDVGGGRGWLAGDTDGLAGWPVTVGVVKVGVSASQEQTLSGTGARVYTVHRGWLGVVTGISAASTGGVPVSLTHTTTTTELSKFMVLFYASPRFSLLIFSRE